MSALTYLIRRLSCDRGGTATIEFALIGSTIIMLMLGVLQIGMAMQSYNAIRNVAADTARFAVVEYQRGSAPTTAALEIHAQTIATAAPYLLKPDAFIAEIEDAATQRVDGAREITLTVTYTVPVVLPFANWRSLSIDFSRPIFVLSSPEEG